MNTRPRFMDHYNYTASTISLVPIYENDGFKPQNCSPVVGQKVEIDMNKYKEQLEQI